MQDYMSVLKVPLNKVWMKVAKITHVLSMCMLLVPIFKFISYINKATNEVHFLFWTHE
jgi:hypothetical protein